MRDVQIGAEITILSATQAPHHAEVQTLNRLRLLVGIGIGDVENFAHSFQTGTGKDASVGSGGITTHDVRVVRAVLAQQIVQRQGVLATEQTHHAGLLDLPPVGGDGEVTQFCRNEARLDDQTDREGFRLFRLQVRITGAALLCRFTGVVLVEIVTPRLGDLGSHRGTAVTQTIGQRTLAVQGLAIDPVNRLVRAGDLRGVNLFQVRCAEALSPRGTNTEAVNNIPCTGNLRLGHRAKVRILLEAPSQLDFEIVDQRDAHVRRYQRSGDFQIGREDVTLAIGVRVFRLVDQVRRLDAGQIGIADRAVNTVVAVIVLGFGTQFDTGRDTDRTGGKLIDVRT